MTVFVIEDATHAEVIGEPYATLADAFSELQRIAEIPFGQGPNMPPCKGWHTCDREYCILEYDETTAPRSLKANTKVLLVNADEVRWYL